MADNIQYIHANKLAKYLKEYIGKDGIIYVGQKDGRLAKKRVSLQEVANLKPTSTTGVKNVTATLPIISNGGSTPNISITQASSTSDGYITAADYILFSAGGNPGNNTLIDGGTFLTPNDNTLIDGGSFI